MLLLLKVKILPTKIFTGTFVVLSIWIWRTTGLHRVPLLLPSPLHHLL